MKTLMWEAFRKYELEGRKGAQAAKRLKDRLHIFAQNSLLIEDDYEQLAEDGAWSGAIYLNNKEGAS